MNFSKNIDIIMKYINNKRGYISMSATSYSDVWNLEIIFKGGSESKEFADHLNQTTELIELFEAKVRSWSPLNTNEDSLVLQELLEDFERAAKKLRQAGAFVGADLALLQWSLHMRNLMHFLLSL
jgi:hypothetical protein